jgi:hypothetical protein
MRLRFDFFGVATGASLDDSPSFASESPAPNDILREDRFLFFPNVGRLTTDPVHRVSATSLRRSEYEIGSDDKVEVLPDPVCGVSALPDSLSSYTPILRAMRPEPARFMLWVCGGVAGQISRLLLEFTSPLSTGHNAKISKSYPAPRLPTGSTPPRNSTIATVLTSNNRQHASSTARTQEGTSLSLLAKLQGQLRSQ